MFKKFSRRKKSFWFLAASGFLITAAFILFQWKGGVSDKISDRIPAQFSQQELQYAEVLWGDSEAETENSFPDVQPQWAGEDAAENPYNYSSDPLAEDLHRQTQEDYHSRLYEEWRRYKEKTAEKAEERAVSSHSGGGEAERIGKTEESSVSSQTAPPGGDPSQGQNTPSR